MADERQVLQTRQEALQLGVLIQEAGVLVEARGKV
jgi:hypothetical protein